MVLETRLVFCLAGLLALTGCQLTTPWSAGSPPDAPRALTASAVPAHPDGVLLSWSEPYDIYELEWRIEGESWRTAAGLEPLGPSAARLTLGVVIPEGATLRFRIRGAIDGRWSGWSGEATLVSAILSPSDFAVQTGVTGSPASSPIMVSWTDRSLVATEVLLERAARAGAAQSSWEPLPDAVLGAGGYVDDLVDEGIAYGYRLRVGTGGTWSDAQEAWSEPVQLAAVSGLRAVRIEEGVRLTWTNRSVSAEVLGITTYTREPPSWDQHFTLTSPTEDWIVPAPLVWPAASYQVTTGRPSVYRYAGSRVARIEPFVVPGAVPLAASARLLPAGEWFARDAEGRVHVAEATYTVPRLHRATTAGHETHVLAGATALAAPGVLLDDAGAPHTVFVRGSPAGVTAGDLVHEWWTGTEWRSEVIATDVVAPGGAWTPRAWFGLGADGVQVLYRSLDPTLTQESLVHVATGPGGIERTVVPVTSAPDLSRLAAGFAVGADGTALVVQHGTTAGGGAVLVVATRSPGGTWSDECAPVGAVRDGPWLVAGEGGDVAIGYAHLSEPASTELRVIRRQGGVWSTPEVVTSTSVDRHSVRLGGTPDLSRLAITAHAGGTVVYARAEDGWGGVSVGPGAPPRAGLGFTPSGRLWAIYAHDSAAALVGYSVFDEVR